MKVGEILGRLLFGKLCRDFKEVSDRLSGALEKQREMELKLKAQEGFADAVRKGHALRMDRLEGESRALKGRVEALEVKQEELKGRTLGWQEGFGGEVRRQLRHLDERIAKLLQSDDSGQFEISQWIEELKAVRKSLSALEKRVETVERCRPIVVLDKEPKPLPSIPPAMPCVPQSPVRWEEPAAKPPAEFTCQADGRGAEGRQ